MDTYNSLFFVGIKGVAMANLARIFQQMGKTVAGSDVKDSFITDQGLTDNSIQIIYSFDASKLPKDIDTVVYSAAHQGTQNPQVLEAQKRGIKVIHQAELLGELLQNFKQSIAVAGCHGKTTTSSLLAYALQQLQVNPSYMVGVSAFNDQPGGAYSCRDYFVVEADEYGMNPPQDKTPKFFFLHPTHTIITNIDFDHPDVYKNIEETKDAFITYIKAIIHLEENDRRIVACNDDPHIKDIIDSVHEPIVTYGRNEEAHVQIKSIQSEDDKTHFTLYMRSFGNYTGQAFLFETSLFCDKNVLNATGVIVMLMCLGFEPAQIAEAIKGFTGAKRRFELKTQIGETYLFDDYGHHPEEIRATIQAAKMRFPEKRIVVIFQPHTFSRTKELQNEFVEALSHADESLLLPVFASARETKPQNPVDSSTLEKIAKKQGILFIHSYISSKELLADLKSRVKKGDVIFTMGAGDVYKLEEEISYIISTL
jgi:UDP-N-acetylmuramate--alanine ligase